MKEAQSCAHFDAIALKKRYNLLVPHPLDSKTHYIYIAPKAPYYFLRILSQTHTCMTPFPLLITDMIGCSDSVGSILLTLTLFQMFVGEIYSSRDINMAPILAIIALGLVVIVIWRHHRYFSKLDHIPGQSSWTR